MTKTEVDSVKKQLRWFIGLAIGVLGINIQISLSNAGFKKIILLRMDNMEQNFISKTNTMQDNIKKNATLSGDMAAQAIEEGWYKPSEKVFNQ